jgi:hypothetical protein
MTPPVLIIIAAASLSLAILPTPSYAQSCKHLRWECQNKDKLGLTGEGTCKRYRAECGGGGGGDGGGSASTCKKLRWACNHKDELGLKGAGTCQRYRETCG